jgi:putative membrane protein
MKSKLIFVKQLVTGISLIIAATAVYGQRYGGMQPRTPGGTTTQAPAAPQPAYQPDNPFFRKSASPSPAGATTTSATNLSAKDKKFLMDAVSTGTWEVATGRSAEQKAQNSATKQLAGRMIADYSKTNQELVDLGKRKGLSISPEGKPQQISADGFDKRYLNLVVQDQQEAVTSFDKEAKSGDDAEIRKWAAKTLPLVRQRLATAKDAFNKAK